MTKLKHLAFGAALLGGTALVSPASATLQIAVDVSGTQFLCVDNAACDTNGATGILTIGTTTVNGVTFAGSSQTQAVGPPTNALLTNSEQITNTSGSTKTITFAVGGTDFAFPTATFDASGSATFLTAAGTTLNLGWFGDTANNQGADSPTDLPGVSLASASFLSTGTDSFSTGPITGPFATTGPYSWTMSASGDLVSGATATITSRGQDIIADVVPVPEPGSLLIFGTALVGLGLVVRRRQKKDAVGNALAA